MTFDAIVKYLKTKTKLIFCLSVYVTAIKSVSCAKKLISKELEKFDMQMMIGEKRKQLEAITLIYKLGAITIRSDNGTNMPRVINNRRGNASQHS
jgi:hypothetical protein